MTQALPSTGIKRCSWDMSLTDTQVDDVLWAARTGDLEVWNILKKELDVTAALASSNDSGNTALHYAAANGHLEFVRQVLPQANLEILLLQNESGNTPLHWAAFNGHLNMAEALVDRIEALEMQDEVTAKRLRAEEDQREHQRHAEKIKKKKTSLRMHAKPSLRTTMKCRASAHYGMYGIRRAVVLCQRHK